MSDRVRIRQFLAELLRRKGDPEPFQDSDQLVSCGRLQSIDVVRVVVFLETEYDVDFAQIGFDQNQVGSVDAIVALLTGGG
jgi:acyl carrier protein